jgi:hypothetical protein
MPRPKGSADLLKDRRKRALALLELAGREPEARSFTRRQAKILLQAPHLLTWVRSPHNLDGPLGH